MTTNNNLNRFIEAQETSYNRALSEIKNGKKQSHWMWYIFPQIQGLGFSETSMFYAVKDIKEAEEFLKHPVLGQRLVEISKELLGLQGNDPHKILGSPDDVKLHSSMTLFASLENTNPVFEQVLEKFYNGTRDEKTLRILGKKQ